MLLASQRDKSRSDFGPVRRDTLRKLAYVERITIHKCTLTVVRYGGPLA